MKSNDKISIVIADDHEMIIEGLKSLLDDISDIEIVGAVSDGRQLLELLKFITPDIILMDLDMPVMNGFEATQAIKKSHPDIKIIALTVHGELGVIAKLREMDMEGFLLKNTSQHELVNAIRMVHSGNRYYTSQITQKLIHSLNNNGKEIRVPEPALTDRETEILKLIAEGKSNVEIGEQLFISPRTVDTHRTNLMKKLQVNNIAGLIRFAFRSGLIE